MKLLSGRVTLALALIFAFCLASQYAINYWFGCVGLAMVLIPLLLIIWMVGSLIIPFLFVTWVISCMRKREALLTTLALASVVALKSLESLFAAAGRHGFIRGAKSHNA